MDSRICCCYVFHVVGDDDCHDATERQYCNTAIHVCPQNSTESERSYLPTIVFASGYLTAWAGFSALATGAQWLLEDASLLNKMMATTSPVLGGGLLLVAGLWQFTPWKYACLRHCRSPLIFLMARWRSGRIGTFVMGMDHGAFCLGCCWFLMALLFFGGIMNLWWIGGLALYVLASCNVITVCCSCPCFSSN